MARPIIHHRAAEYDALFFEVREGLKRLVQTQQDVVTPACTGTGAMEAAVTNTLSAGDRVIVVNAGAFAQRCSAVQTAAPIRPPTNNAAPSIATAYSGATLKASRPSIASCKSFLRV